LNSLARLLACFSKMAAGAIFCDLQSIARCHPFKKLTASYFLVFDLRKPYSPIFGWKPRPIIAITRRSAKGALNSSIKSKTRLPWSRFEPWINPK
jgi:hypothetical protein